jgi:glycosyltransferase involved in cell wall biosynthesis
MPIDVSVVVLAYNEAENLEPAVLELLGELRTAGRSFELIIVDDGSTDATGTLADDLAAREASVRAVHHGRNLGLGGGYRTGLREARGKLLTFFPADGQFPAAIITQFLPLTASHDLVLGYLPERASSFVAKALSLGERVLYRLLFGRFPRFQGIFMIHRRLIDEIPLVSDGRGWGIVMELIVRAARGPYSITSVPTECRPRRAGESKVQNTRTIVANLKQVVALRRLIATPGQSRPTGRSAGT